MSFPVRVSAARGGSLSSSARPEPTRLIRTAAHRTAAPPRRSEGAGGLPAQMLVTTWRDGGPAGSARKLWAAIRLALPVLLRRRRSAAGVGAYFDLITDEARLFYGDNFHVGYFRSGSETLAEALDAHTDLVGEMARLQTRQLVLDAGCGIGRRRCGSPRAGSTPSSAWRPPATSASPSGTRTGSCATFTGCFAQAGTSASPTWPCAPARRGRRTTR